MRFFSVMALSGLLLVSACSVYNGKYAYLSSKPITLYDLQRPELVVAKEISATSSRSAFFFIPTGRIPTIEAAVNELLEEYHGDYLKNVKVHFRSFQLMPYYDYKAWEVTGDVIRAE